MILLNYLPFGILSLNSQPAEPIHSWRHYPGLTAGTFFRPIFKPLPTGRVQSGAGAFANSLTKQKPTPRKDGDCNH